MPIIQNNLDTQYIDGFTEQLLHASDAAHNKLVDLTSGDGKDIFYLDHLSAQSLSEYAIRTVASRIGETANTTLLDSAIAGTNSYIASGKANTFTWQDGAGEKNAENLDKFIKGAYKDMTLRGNNPLFMSIGVIKWRLYVQKNLKEVSTPILVVPIRLIRTSKTSPVCIEFPDDEIYLNPCLVARLRSELDENIAKGLPRPDQITGDEYAPVDIKALAEDGGQAWLNAVKAYIDGCKIKTDDVENDTLFECVKDVVAISQYRHDELSTYYDIHRNRELIYKHPLVAGMFKMGEVSAVTKGTDNRNPVFILPRDKAQENMIREVVNGSSVIIKGPPGTGKTLTIANMIAALLAEGKSVLFMSKKISALTEVNAKLPDSLRKFVLLLEGETESSAANINPKSLLQEMKGLVDYRSTYKPSATLDADIISAQAEAGSALARVEGYRDLMFDKNIIASDTLYAAMDNYCKSDCDVVEFMSAKDALSIDRTALNAMLYRAERAGRLYGTITGDYTHPATKCPWLNVSENFKPEEALAMGGAIGDNARAIYRGIKGVADTYGVNIEGLNIWQTSALRYNILSNEQINSILNDKEVRELCAEVGKKLGEYLSVSGDGTNTIEFQPFVGMENSMFALQTCRTDGTLTLAQIKNIKDNADVFKSVGGSPIAVDVIEKLVEIINQMTDNAKKKEEHRYKFYTFFDGKKLDEDGDGQMLNEACQALSQYFGTQAQKPSLLDFKGKKFQTQLSALALNQPVSFGDLLSALVEWNEMAKLQRAIDSDTALINSVLTKRLDDKGLECLFTVLSHTSTRLVHAFVTTVTGECESVMRAAAAISAPANITLAQLKSTYQIGVSREHLLCALDEVNAKIKLFERRENCEFELLARSVAGVYFISQTKGVNYLDETRKLEFVKDLSATANKLGANIDGLLADLPEFRARFFANYFTANARKLTFADAKIMADEFGNREVATASASYTAIKQGGVGEPVLQLFFEPVEQMEIKDGKILREMLEHSYYSIAISAVTSSLRLGVETSAQQALKQYVLAEKKLNELNLLAVERTCVRSIEGSDRDFNFLNSTAAGVNMRKIFKNNADGIRRLKRCIIASPYTVSLLFRNPAFNNFDVLIADEASQIEPALIIPGLFRAKQCVVVGDEYQMPPIKHFEERTQASDVPSDEDSFKSLEPEVSALTLALQGNSFKICELICHYRSNTESLIAFSQKLFYHSMRTFPSAVPRIEPSKGVNGLGFQDIYLEDAYSETGGINKGEAEEVVRQLNRHFDNYFDEETGKLSMSVGVVAFGTSQVDLIRSYVDKDKELSKKISLAKENFKDVEEKLIFFKAIEQVQGQEMDHLILSMTHGKKKTGVYQRFGQLNQGKLGIYIFNVAVTRAKSMITVIHSVRGGEITNPSIEYIGQYLSVAAKFAEGGKGQFVSSGVNSGFLRSVADYIVSCGIAEERIVFNYGVTNGSVRIPIAILTPELDRALIGIWCERPVEEGCSFLDFNAHYFNALTSRGWKMHRIDIYNWINNATHEKQSLGDVIAEIK